MRTTSKFVWGLSSVLICVGCEWQAPPRDESTAGSPGDAGPIRADQPEALPPPRPVDPFEGVSPFPFDAPVLRSEVPPTPIQGGTLLIANDGATAVVADPDRDRVLLVDLTRMQVQITVNLEAGDEPGRLSDDTHGQVHVVLRRAGDIATIDLSSGQLVRRSEVCRAPQGIAHDPATDLLHVACAEGELVSLSATSGEVTRRLPLDNDLRDVVVQGEQLVISRLKSAELLTVDSEGQIVERRRPETLTGPFPPVFDPAFPPDAHSEESKTMIPNVAWRMVADGSGTLIMTHQRSQVDPVDLGLPPLPVLDSASAADAGTNLSAPVLPLALVDPPGSAYGSGGGDGLGCDGVVQTGVTLFHPDGAVHSLPPVALATLPVDVSRSPDGRWLAIAVAGELGIPSATFADGFFFTPLTTNALLIDLQARRDGIRCLMPSFPFHEGQGVAVAFGPLGELYMLTRDRNQLLVSRDVDDCPDCGPMAGIDLGGDSRRDTGHDLFHHNAGAGLACASCHPGGKDDGHTWQFLGLGPRRTQQFVMGLRGTEPLHWDAEFDHFHELVAEVFVRRMGGPHLSRAETDALGDWIETLRPLPAPRTDADPAVQRGQALFESPEVGCATCHAGPKLTNNLTVDVGTGGWLQVPSLVGVAYRAPFMHDGCAPTLHARFDPGCGGGDAHGTTSHLTPDEIDDLVAYLESL